MKTPLILVLLSMFAPAHGAKDCPQAPFRPAGARCADLGLDTDRAVCRPGDRYAMHCDDRGGGHVRTCPSSRRCEDTANSGGDRGPGGSRNDHRGDHRYPAPVPYPEAYYGYRPGPWHGPGHRPDYYLVPFRGDLYRCDLLRYDRRGQPRGYCYGNRRNVDCRGYCERY